MLINIPNNTGVDLEWKCLRVCNRKADSPRCAPLKLSPYIHKLSWCEDGVRLPLAAWYRALCHNEYT